MNATKNPKKNPKEVVTTLENNHVVFSAIKDSPWPVRNRQYVCESAWMKQIDGSGSYIYAFRPPMTDEFEDFWLIDFGKNTLKRLMRGDSRGYAVIRNLDEHSSKLVWIQQIDPKGNLPAQITNSLLPRSLRPVFQVRDKLNRDDEVDKMEREKLMDVMRDGLQGGGLRQRRNCHPRIRSIENDCSP